MHELRPVGEAATSLLGWSFDFSGMVSCPSDASVLTMSVGVEGDIAAPL